MFLLLLLIGLVRSTRLVVKVYAEQCVRQLPPAHHHRRSLRLEVAEQQPPLLAQLRSRREVLDAAGNAVLCLEEIAEVERADPVLGAEQIGGLTTLVYKRFLDLSVHRHVGAGVVLHAEPRDDRHQRAVGAAPALVVKAVLHVVVVLVLPVHELQHARLHPRRRAVPVHVHEPARARAQRAAGRRQCAGRAQQRPAHRQAEARVQTRALREAGLLVEAVCAGQQVDGVEAGRRRGGGLGRRAPVLRVQRVDQLLPPHAGKARAGEVLQRLANGEAMAAHEVGGNQEAGAVDAVRAVHRHHRVGPARVGEVVRDHAAELVDGRGRRQLSPGHKQLVVGHAGR
mmetsp:Transcript_27829/g.70051  ORF Transcript_27829/g.70051 Transcript_27829/m.70051 type:complete len:341 (+) Transcript_27829:161-1183(+)